jgi:hypothetical protein
MGTYDRLQLGLFVVSQGDGGSKRHGHNPAPSYKGEMVTHAMTMLPFSMVAQLKYTGTGFTKWTSSPFDRHNCGGGCARLRWGGPVRAAQHGNRPKHAHHHGETQKHEVP